MAEKKELNTVEKERQSSLEEQSDSVQTVIVEKKQSGDGMHIKKIFSDSLTRENYREQVESAIKSGEQFALIKGAVFGEQKEFDDDERTLTAYISTKEPDRQGDVVNSKGMDNSVYRKNPVVLWAHSSRELPIAKSLWEKADNFGIKAKMKFDSRPEAQEIYRLYKDGFLNAFSIGFIPRKYERRYENDNFTGFDFNEWELLEYSPVPIPANPGALVDAYKQESFTHPKVIECLSGSCKELADYIVEEQENGSPLTKGEFNKELKSCAQSMVELIEAMKSQVKALAEDQEVLNKRVEKVLEFYEEDNTDLESVETLVENEKEPGDGEASQEMEALVEKVQPYDAKALIRRVCDGEVSRAAGRITD